MARRGALHAIGYLLALAASVDIGYTQTAVPSEAATDPASGVLVNCDPLVGPVDAESCKDHWASQRAVSLGSFCMDWSDSPCEEAVARRYRDVTKITTGNISFCRSLLNTTFPYPDFRTSELPEEKIGGLAASVTGRPRMVRNPMVARLDIDNDGRLESILHFETSGPSWRDCDGSVLVQLNDNETDMQQAPLNNLLRSPVTCPDSFRPFLYEGKTYLELRHQKPGRSRLNLITQVLMIERGTLHTVCIFSYPDQP